jgi:hypothetical protein
MTVRYKLRTLLILLAVGPPMLYLAWLYFTHLAIVLEVTPYALPMNVALFLILCRFWRRFRVEAKPS